MENFMMQDSKLLAQSMVEDIHAQDARISERNGLKVICRPNHFLHYLAAKKLGFPIILNGISIDDEGPNDGDNSRDESLKAKRNRFSINPKKNGGHENGSQVEI